MSTEIELFFSTPIIISSQTHPEEFSYEVEQMLERSQATSKWLRDEIVTEEFFEVLFSTGVTPYDLVELWDSGYGYSCFPQK